MPDARPESLDEIVRHSAEAIADQIQTAASWDASEMELQIAAAGALKDFARHAQIKLEGRHNITIATGRPDSLYGSVIVEYKKPGTLASTKDAANNQALVAQLKQRFYDMNREEKRNWSNMLGVGTDGKYFIFLRFRDGKWTEPEPLGVDRYSTERFLWSLYNLGQKGKPYQPEYLHGDFGSESELAREGVRTLYQEILATQNPKAEVFFNQWKILFGEVCGYDVENLSDKLRKLADSYEVTEKPQPAALLFAVHTYYAILIKLLAAEIVSFYNPWMPRQVEKLQSATSPAKLRRELEQLEQGGIFHQMGITNFLEGDLFSWYLAAWSEPVEHLVRRMISKLDEYNPGTFSEDPVHSRDLLKKLYQHLFPKSVRHDLGEYYTPDWLAEHVLNEVGYEGDPDKRVLDPSCGSGTFLVMAINRIRRWYDLNREKCAYDEGELLKKILTNVIGFDLNPLAVMAARTNYLVAIKDLVPHVDRVEIPIYLCDSILTPAEYGDLFTGGTSNVAKVPCSAMKPPHLLVPKEIANSPKEVAVYAGLLEVCIKNGDTPDEFINRCREDGLDITATEAHASLYVELVKLDKANKNGVWARIIKNNFAPLFVAKVDYVIGNPPWITWVNLPEDYRPQTAHLWQHYSIFPHKGLKAKLGHSKDDLSILFTYVCADAYLVPNGKLGFVITQTLFKSKGGGQGFRRFRIGSGAYLEVIHVDDMSDLQPFEGAANRTAVLSVQKGHQTQYPVRYAVWAKKNDVTFTADSDLTAVTMATTRDDMLAFPVDPNDLTSPWITGHGEILRALVPKIGGSDYVARMGAHFGASGAFWLRILAKQAGKFLIENTGGGKKDVPVHSSLIEGDLVFPLVRGRDMSRWFSQPVLGVVMVQDQDNPSRPMPLKVLQRQYPLTYKHIAEFEGLLRKCAILDQFFDPSVDPFYSTYQVGPYTFARNKVLWRQVSDRLDACVATTHKLLGLPAKPCIPADSLCAIAVETEEEAHYICALLNSSISRFIIRSYVSLHPSPHILEYLNIRKWKPENKVFVKLSELSRECHAAVDGTRSERVPGLEAEIDRVAAELWGMEDDELRTIQESLRK